jgi:hypothetical protein
MRKMFLFSAIALMSLSGISWGQYYKVKWTRDTAKGEVFNEYAERHYPPPANYKPFDYDNDGISDLCVFLHDTTYAYKLLNGASYSLTHKIKLLYTFNNNTYQINYLAGFYDIDGDGVREGVMEAYDISSAVIDIAFLNLSTDQIEYVIEGNGPMLSSNHVAFSDIDNDGYIELISWYYVLGHSATPVAQPASLAKIVSPSSKIFPNPFSCSAKIEYYVPMASFVKVSIFDLSGKLVRVLINGNKMAGNFTDQWDGRSNEGKIVAAGQYYYNIQIGNFITNKKVIMLR